MGVRFKYLMTIMVFFTLIFKCIGQNEIKGVILDKETNHPIENVNILSDKTKRGTITNDQGEFFLSYPDGYLSADTLTFSCVGYQSLRLTFKEFKASHYHVYLVKKTETLDEIVVSAKNELNPALRYETLSKMKKGVYGFALIEYGGKLYVIDGDNSFQEDSAKRAYDIASSNPESTFDDFLKATRSDFSFERYLGSIQIYDMATDKWSMLKNVFKKRAYPKANLINGSIYILGGKSLSANRRKELLDDTIEIFDLKTNTLKTEDLNPHCAIKFESLVYKNYLITFGGAVSKDINGTEILTDNMHIYDSTTSKWYDFGNMAEAKITSGIIFNDKIYTFGGLVKGKATSLIESYDLKTNHWKQEGHLFGPVGNAAVVLANGMVYMYYNNSITTLTLKTGVLKSYKIHLNLYEPKILFYDHKLYLVGGYAKDEYTKYPLRDLYAIDEGEFSKTKISNQKQIDG